MSSAEANEVVIKIVGGIDRLSVAAEAARKAAEAAGAARVEVSVPGRATESDPDPVREGLLYLAILQQEGVDVRKELLESQRRLTYLRNASMIGLLVAAVVQLFMVFLALNGTDTPGFLVALSFVEVTFLGLLIVLMRTEVKSAQLAEQEHRERLESIGRALEGGPAYFQSLRLRVAWMRQIGLAEEEIAQLCWASEPRPQIDVEMANLEAAKRLSAVTPSVGTLRRLARPRRQHSEAPGEVPGGQ